MEATIFLTKFGEPGETRKVTYTWADVESVLNRNAIDKEAARLDAVLDAIYMRGQNEFDPQPHPSASAGDYIEMPLGPIYRIEPMGFTRVECVGE